MAKYRYDNITGNTPDLLANFLPTLDPRLIKITDTAPYDISINGDAIFRIAQNSYKLILNGTEILSGGDVFQDFKVWSIIGDDIILLRINRRGEDRPFIIAWVADNNGNRYISGYWTTGTQNNYFEVSQYNFYKCSDNTSGYAFAKMINFVAPVNSVAYSSLAPFTNGGSLAFYGKDIYSCSTLSRDVTVALPNGKNYRTVGTNTMIEIDT